MGLSTQQRSATRRETRVMDALKRGIAHLVSRQKPDGCVAGEVVWCPMLAAQYTIAAHLTGQPLGAHRKQRLLRHFELWQNMDGGWGLHAESHSYLYVTTLTYIALRLMGLSPDEGPCPRAAAWLADQRVVEIPTWGKLWLSMMNLYDYAGVHPVTPEIWLLPKANPAHPSRFYCHTRLIYMGFSYLYGSRFQIPVSPLVEELRAELYPEGWSKIDFREHRSSLADTDTFQAPDTLLRALFSAAGLFERIAPRITRQLALRRILERIVWEERTSQYAGISPVNGTLNALSLFAAGHADFQKAFDGIDYWMWDDADEGLRIAGASSNTWDTAFAAQAIAEGPYAERFGEALEGMHRFLDNAQIRTELPDDFPRYYRVSSLGGYCFGEPDHHWPVSDCTAEAMSAICRIEGGVAPAQRLRPGRLRLAVEFILERHNPDGGWGSYESQRGNRLLERINPAEMFGNCMSEYSYLECTASCVQALADLRLHHPDALDGPLRSRVDTAIQAGVEFIRGRQGPDGSWPGFWGINFTYGTLFGVSGLLAAGVPESDTAIQQACRWLLDHRLPDGAWGEAWESCVVTQYIPHERSQIIMTSWAMMTLIRAGRAGDPETRQALDAGAEVLLRRQLCSGEWRRESQAGIFFNTAGLHYDLYRLYFPVWALGLYAQLDTIRAHPITEHKPAN